MQCMQTPVRTLLKQRKNIYLLAGTVDLPSQTGTSFLGRLDPSDPIWGLFVVLLLVEEFWPLNEALPPSFPPPPPPPWLNE